MATQKSENQEWPFAGVSLLRCSCVSRGGCGQHRKRTKERRPGPRIYVRVVGELKCTLNAYYFERFWVL